MNIQISPASSRSSQLRDPLGQLTEDSIMKDGMANNSTASISQARKAVEQLKMEACMDRIKLNNNKAGESHAAKMMKVFSLTLFKPESTLMERLRKNF
ncbi:Guanine nucleotide-binding protein G(I)/G(S)/G(O) subunit gamma-4 [Anabarilius grahami]|uniref:Guanine nucleotide-binding protein G(I)/G(S)/G(O) subunit gamma-4 n=1 Tax=Anabarilius grahami TaxID=495550 RepID=A0A3N0XJR3_ANAGA|nr:Guanine nucleotide-binding protein G(I)/G(S)/G(O) subunit gamma-4 [Anabarilius grahami]